MTHDKGELQSLRNGIHHPKIVNGLDNKPMQPKPLGEQPKAVRRQEFMVLLMNMGVLACGIGLGLPSVTLNQLTDPNELVHLDKSQASWFASIGSITSPLGALLAALLMDKIGRKRTVILVNLFAIASWALMALALQQDPQAVYIQLIISRCLIGITMGMGSAPSGVYGAEISLAKIRSRLILGVSISVAMGILLVYILGYFIRNDWHLIAIILLAFQVLCLILLVPVIETPSWLMSKGRAKDAKASLYYFRGIDVGQTHPEVEAEFAILLKTIQLKTGEKKTPFYKTLRQPEIHKPLLIMIGLFCCQQFSGIFVVVVYAVQIAIEAGVNIDPILCAVFIGVARTVSTVMMGGFLEKFGRRKAGIISAIGMAICMFTLAATSWFPWLQIPYLPAVLIIIYIITSTLGIFTLPFFMNSEVFPQKVRGTCAGLTGSFGFLMSFFVLKAYPSMRDFMGAENVFALYGIMSVLSILFVYFCLPETKGKSLMEIEEYFRYGKKGMPKAELEVEMSEVLVNGKTYT
ncbi:facilitated trehalose transporter Tret1-like [Episyrphus balteatus]|uniref:facilitated trehalose transporter Tret1-like n=1 Tax=Episyrphus balteatus TaxID=286459 RepID=UPI002486656B|nr:facilitated trehalose transporter Tret1-like [Episyrphus balteatus]